MRVILFADNLTKSMKQAIEETQRRREYQVDYNAKHGITPQTIQKPIREKLLLREETHADKQHKKGRLETLKGTTIRLSKKEVINLESIDPEAMTPAEKNKLARKLNRRMKQAANDLDYELAALLRDTIHKLM